ncbi:MAG: hypothetical protein K0S46_2442 [Moraxellaceae bacterium]|jgi:hypothetical protein|nr:hypothetical protein [Moraxellaceae bacterium]
MKNGASITALSVVTALASSLADAESKTPQSLYCTGETRILFGQNALNQTSAYLELGQTSTHLEINGVGFGSGPGKPKMLSATQAHMPITLKSAVEGGPELKAQISLDIYSGALSVVYFDDNKNFKQAFRGDCKKAVPLLNI